jgi:hypothetical protein
MCVPFIGPLPFFFRLQEGRGNYRNHIIRYGSQIIVRETLLQGLEDAMQSHAERFRSSRAALS